MNLSVSFYYNLAKPKKGMCKYFSFPEETRLKIANTRVDMMEERDDHCLMTEVYYSENIEEMTAALLSYAEENKICLQGMIYGREGTNFFKNGIRTGLYKLYAPIQTGREK